MRTFMKSTFLVPGKAILPKWPVIACDQFTSEKGYWDEVEKTVGDAASTLRLVFPEIYLREERETRIRAINEAMSRYLASGVLETFRDCFVYIERTLMDGQVRRGLLGVLDLEDYSYAPDAKTPVRATEKTVPERIPPRVLIRENAPLELSHVLLFADDPADGILAPLTAERGSLPVLYDLDLMMGGGHLTGYLVAGAAAEDTQARIDRYEEGRRAGKESPVLYLVGDGNHSLATAKTCYEKRRAEGAGEEELALSRYAMVELGNIRDDALQFEPIHRLVRDAEPLRLLENAKPGPAVNAMLAFHLWMERRLVRVPHVQMVEVAVHAYNAARENDR